MGGAYLRFRVDEALTYAAVYLDLPASTAMMRLMNANRILVYEVDALTTLTTTRVFVMLGLREETATLILIFASHLPVSMEIVQTTLMDTPAAV